MSQVQLFEDALALRESLLTRLEAEATDCYRLFHGATEGDPGLSVDRYGPYILVQRWDERERADLDSALAATFGRRFDLPILHRQRGADPAHGSPSRAERSQDLAAEVAAIGAEPVAMELGIRYDVRPWHRGRDPLLYLDLRAGRRFMLQESEGLEVLNLFSYTCGIGLAAAKGGARLVWNVDFSEAILEIGAANAALNGLENAPIRNICEDALPVMRQLADLSIPLRRGKERRFLKLKPRQFDLVVLDPPPWSTGPFGAVDSVRDYQGLFKPAILATKPGGRILAANHAKGVERDEWMESLARCAIKAGRQLQHLESLDPEADFPSPDGRPLSKFAIATVL
jgi:23S rRNA (cytosine1962-C5)-methyltransferase